MTSSITTLFISCKFGFNRAHGRTLKMATRIALLFTDSGRREPRQRSRFPRSVQGPNTLSRELVDLDRAEVAHVRGCLDRLVRGVGQSQ
jgi:hypothetical protein